MPVLKARIGGVWVPVSSAGGGGAGEEEVFVGPTDPTAAVPTAELWYDTDAAAAMPPDYRWNTAWGTINRIQKGTTEAGYNNTEYVITGFSGMAGPTVGGRYTQVSLNLVFSAVTQPSAQSYYFIRLRTGSGAAGAILQEFIYPWGVSQQSFGGGSTGYINTMIQTTPLALQAGATFSWTIQCGGAGLAVGCAAGSWASVEDLGPVTGSSPAPNPGTYFATTTERDAAPPPSTISTITTVGTINGTGTAMPRRYMWNGSAWQFLDWWAPAGRPGCTLSTGTSAIGVGATVYLPWTTEVQDNDGWHSGTSDTVTVPTGWAGRYVCSFQLNYSTSGVNSGNLICTVNGAAVYSTVGMTAFGVATMSLHGNFSAGNVLRFGTYNSTGASYNVVASVLSIDWLGP